MDNKQINLEIKEELMIYIANNLPFIVKGSFLTSQYHTDPQARLLNGGDIDLIHNTGNRTIETPDVLIEPIFRIQYDQALGSTIKGSSIDSSKVFDNFSIIPS